MKAFYSILLFTTFTFASVLPRQEPTPTPTNEFDPSELLRVIGSGETPTALAEALALVPESERGAVEEQIGNALELIKLAQTESEEGGQPVEEGEDEAKAQGYDDSDGKAVTEGAGELDAADAESGGFKASVSFPLAIGAGLLGFVLL